MGIKGFARLSLTLLTLLSTSAMADTLDFMTTDGPMRLHIEQDGRVRGEYPKRSGVMYGRITPDGSIQGVWAQPTSDHPCRRMHGDTYAWGGFSISNVYHHHVLGTWGYCDEDPNRDWHIERF